jgi:hypothetical protein
MRSVARQPGASSLSEPLTPAAAALVREVLWQARSYVTDKHTVLTKRSASQAPPQQLQKLSLRRRLAMNYVNASFPNASENRCELDTLYITSQEPSALRSRRSRLRSLLPISSATAPAREASGAPRRTGWAEGGLSAQTSISSLADSVRTSRARCGSCRPPPARPHRLRPAERPPLFPAWLPHW